MWGCTGYISILIRYRYVFPTHVGVYLNED
jgi:hypothetical protein